MTSGRNGGELLSPKQAGNHVMARFFVSLSRTLGGLLGAGSSSLALSLSNGTVPIGKEWLWIGPILIGVMMYIAVTMAQAAVKRQCEHEFNVTKAILESNANEWKELYMAHIGIAAKQVVATTPSLPLRERIRKEMEEIGVD